MSRAYLNAGDAVARRIEEGIYLLLIVGICIFAGRLTASLQFFENEPVFEPGRRNH
jgi:hypothetical protein